MAAVSGRSSACFDFAFTGLVFLLDLSAAGAQLVGFLLPLGNDFFPDLGLESTGVLSTAVIKCFATEQFDE